MFIKRFIIAAALCAAAAGASAQSFERQLAQFSLDAAAAAKQSRQLFINAQAAARPERGAWHKVSGFDDTFTLEMPAAPVHIEEAARLPGTGAPVAFHVYEAHAGARAFVAVSGVLPAGATFDMRGGLDGVAKSLGLGKWISVTSLKHQGLPALEGVALKDGSEYRLLVVVRGLQYFSVMYVGPDGTARSDDANRFFDSLNIR